MTTLEDITKRIEVRMTGETYDKTVIGELAQTVLDRLCIRLGVTSDTFPSSFVSIAVDASVKLYRRRFYEGISSENVSNLSDSFVEDILNEYSEEISTFRNNSTNGIGSGKVVRFL
jgi:hypothetical protein